MKSTLASILEEVRPLVAQGRPADYIPALAEADPSLLGIAITEAGGGVTACGAAGVRFTIQSISKVLTLAYVLERVGEAAVFSRVGKEPTGDPFNSIIRLETSALRKPFNPMINAGAIVVVGLLPGDSPDERFEGLRAFVARVVGRPDVGIDERVYESERATAARNRAIGWVLKEMRLFEPPVEDVLDVYIRQCSIALDAVELSRIGAFLAFDGRSPLDGRELVAPRTARIVKSVMMTCGLYTGSGAFGIDAGIPAKSGVGGGIVAAVRNRMGIGVFNPALDSNGNSVGGVEALVRLSARLDLGVV
ncbi:MAG TPA: glutaminase A [Myxococcales bacterium]|nr:glutaminase A [Myxococcales bacterium]